MEFVLKLHGEMRWLVALVAAIALVKFGLGWLRKSEFAGIDRALMAIFTGLLDLNLLMGALLLVGLGGGMAAVRIEHATFQVTGDGLGERRRHSAEKQPRSQRESPYDAS